MGKKKHYIKPMVNMIVVNNEAQLLGSSKTTTVTYTMAIDAKLNPWLPYMEEDSDKFDW